MSNSKSKFKLIQNKEKLNKSACGEKDSDNKFNNSILPLIPNKYNNNKNLS